MINYKKINIAYNNQNNVVYSQPANNLKIEEVFIEAIDNLPTDKPYPSELVKIFRKMIHDYNNPTFKVAKKMIENIFEKRIFNPFNIKQKIFSAIKDFFDGFLNPTRDDLLLLWNEGAEVYVNSKSTVLEFQLQKHFSVDDKYMASKIIDEEFRKILNDKFVSWDPAYDFNTTKNSEILKFWVLVNEISYFSVKESNLNSKEMSLISNDLKNIYKYDYNLTEDQYRSKVNDYILLLEGYVINSSTLKQDSNLYKLIKRMRDDLIQQEISRLKIEKIEKDKIDAYIENQNISTFASAFPDVHAILIKYGLTSKELNFMEPVITGNSIKYISEIGATEIIDGEQEIIFTIPRIEIDERLSLMDQATRELNKEFSTKSINAYGSYGELEINSKFGINATDMAKIFTDDGFDVSIDKIIGIMGTELNFNVDFLNSIPGYEDRLELEQIMKLKIVDGKLYAFIYLKSIDKKTGNIIDKKEFEIDFNITYSRIIDYFQNELDVLVSQFHINQELYMDQFMGSNGKIIDKINKYGQDLFLIKYTNFTELISDINEKMTQFNLYRNDISYEIDISIINNRLQMSITLKDKIFEQKPLDPRSKGASYASIAPANIDILNLPYMGKNESISLYKEDIYKQPYWLIFDGLLPTLTPYPNTYTLNFGNEVQDGHKIKIAYIPKTIYDVKDYITENKYEIFSQSNYHREIGIGEGITIKFGKQIYSFLDKKSDVLLQYSTFIKLNFEKASQKYIDDALKKIIDSLPKKDRDNKYVIAQITELYNEWIYNKKKENYYYYISKDDIDNKLKEFLGYQGDLDSNDDLLDLIRKVFDPREIPDVTKKLLENSDNFVTLEIIASQLGDVDTDLLRSMLQNEGLINKVNYMTMKQIRSFIQTLDKTKKVTKYSYFGIGVGLAAVAMASLGSSLYLSRAGVKRKTAVSKIKTSNFIKIITFLFALFAASGSLVTMLLFFLDKGGF